MKCRINPELKAAPRYNERRQAAHVFSVAAVHSNCAFTRVLGRIDLAGYRKQSERRAVEARLKAFGHDKELALDEAYAGFKVKK